MKRHDPVIAFVLSAIVPGLGQLYNNEVRKAIVYFLILLVVLAATLFSPAMKYFEGFLVIIGARVLFTVVSVIDAIGVAANKIEKIKRSPRQWLVYAFVLVLGIWIYSCANNYLRTHVIRPFKITSGGLKPALMEGDRLYADLDYFETHPVERGQIIIFPFPLDTALAYIQRCVAVEGDTVEIRSKVLYINNEKAEEPYALEFTPTMKQEDYLEKEIKPKGAGNRDHYGPILIPDGSCFVLGDNRDNSIDSRYIGMIPLK